MRAVVIYPSPSEVVIEVELSENDSTRLRQLQALVGGYIEALPVRGQPKATCFGHDEAKLVSAEENPLATWHVYGDKRDARRHMAEEKAKLAAAGVAVIEADTGDPREPFIAGVVVITGFDPDTGETTAIPAELAAELLQEV